MTPSKRTLQLSIRSLLILVGCLCIWLGIEANAARTQREMVKAIKDAGGMVFYDWQLNDDRSESGREHPPGTAWLRRWLGDEYFQSVAAVDFGAAWIRDEDFPPIERLGSIRHLWLGETRVTDAIAPRIRRQHELKSLDLTRTALADSGMRELANLRKLTFLSIAKTEVTDAGMRELAQLTNLETLFAGGRGDVTDAGVACLRRLPRLSVLGLVGYGITDRSIDTLRTMRSLRTVDFASTSVSQQGLDELMLALPGCAASAGVE